MLRSTSLLSRAVAYTICMSVAAAAAPGSAQGVAKAKARSLYAEGDKALQAGDIETAQKDFDEAYRTLPNAAVLLKIADCQSRRADYRSAVDTFGRYLTERPSAPDRGSVESKLAELKKKPGQLSVKSSPAGASIWLDDTDTMRVTPATITVAPGEHSLVVKAPGYDDSSQTVTIEFAALTDLTVTLAETAEAPSAAPAPRAPAPAPIPLSDDDYHATPAFWVAVGATGAAVAVTTVFGVMALGKSSDFKDHPARSTYDAGKRDALISDVALGVAGAAAITAAVLFFTSKGGEKPSDQAAGVAPIVGPRGGGLTGYVHF